MGGFPNTVCIINNKVEFEGAETVEWRLNGSSDVPGVIRQTENGSKVRIRSFSQKAWITQPLIFFRVFIINTGKGILE